MAKKNVREVPPVPGISQATVTTGPVPQPQPQVQVQVQQPKPVVLTKKGDPRANVQWSKVIPTLWSHYVNNTPQRIKLVDAFMMFLVVVGVIQFINCALLGTFVSPGKLYVPLSSANVYSALQRFPLWILCDSWTIRLDRYVAIDTNSKIQALTSCPASLRLQTNEASKTDCPSVSPERSVLPRLLLKIWPLTLSQGIRRLCRLQYHLAFLCHQLHQLDGELDAISLME